MTRLLKFLPALLIALSALPGRAAAAEPSWRRVFYTPAGIHDFMVNGKTAIVATSKGLYFSHDLRKFRRAEAAMPGNPEITSLVAAPGLSEIYAVSSRGYLLRSRDRGRQFGLIGQFPDIRISSVALSKDGMLFIATSAGVMSSRTRPVDAPERKMKRYSMPWEMLVMALPIWRKAPLASDSDLWNDWAVSREGNALRIAASPSEPGHIIVDMSGEGALQTLDGGSSWNAIVTAAGERVSGPIAFGADTRVFIGQFLSEDGGATFRRLSIQSPSAAAEGIRTADMAVQAVAVGSHALIVLPRGGESLYLSRADGSWTAWALPGAVREKIRKNGTARVKAEPPSILWIAADGQGLFRGESGSVEK